MRTRKWFSPKSVCKCSLKCPPFGKALWHWVQGNCFSPECVLKCVVEPEATEKVLGHRLQGNCFSPEYVLKGPSNVASNVLHLRKPYERGMPGVHFCQIRRLLMVFRQICRLFSVFRQNRRILAVSWVDHICFKICCFSVDL